MKYILFGTGEYYNRYKKWFDKEEIVALIDNAVDKQNTWIDGIPVLSPVKGLKLTYDKIVILSFFVEEMKTQLIAMGVSMEGIWHFYDMHQILLGKCIRYSIEHYVARGGDLFESKGHVLLLSHDLALTGPAIALYQVALTLKKANYNVTYASMLDGELRKTLIAEGIHVIVDANLQIETMDEAKWTGQYELIFCNTINYHIFLSQRKLVVPVIWWLHDPEFFFAGIRKENLEKINLKNLRVCSVGLLPESAMHKYRPDMKCSRLLYGVRDNMGKECVHNISKTGRLVFTTIGYINSIKGQDILYSAINRLSDVVNNGCFFYFVGQDTSPMAQSIRRGCGNRSNIIMTGIVDREEINTILSQTDLLICPSRSDAMPTVCAEAMMHGVPCLVSDSTGTAEYITDEEDGLIFQNENIEQLANKILFCAENPEKLQEMGVKARRIYEQYFSMEVFERQLLTIVEETKLASKSW